MAGTYPHFTEDKASAPGHPARQGWGQGSTWEAAVSTALHGVMYPTALPPSMCAEIRKGPNLPCTSFASCNTLICEQTSYLNFWKTDKLNSKGLKKYGPKNVHQNNMLIIEYQSK